MESVDHFRGYASLNAGSIAPGTTKNRIAWPATAAMKIPSLAEDKGADCLNHVLDKFCHYSRHYVNRLKTQVFFSRNVSEKAASRLSAKLGFTKVNNLGKYLGIPCFHNRVGVGTFQFLVDKVRARLLGCSETIVGWPSYSESVIHVVRDCGFAQAVWKSVVPRSNWNVFFNLPLVKWIIWNTRNAEKFNFQCDTRWVKVNVDGSVSKVNSSTTLGGVIRDLMGVGLSDSNVLWKWLLYGYKMTLYIGREASKLWKRICAETTTEINLLLDNWKYVLAGLIFQYIHGLAAHGVHYLHRPGPTLQDLGYFLLPELGQDKAYISEMVFTFVFLSFVLWTLHPFTFKSKKIYTVLVWCRVLAFLVASQILRIITFYSTQLPGPNYHCREGSKLARLPKPSNVQEVLLINFPQGVVYGCGDLIFSSHMIFTLVFVLTYQKYGTRRCIKQCAWLLAIIQSLLIVASRKHYTVDIAVAWYTVNLVVFFVNKKLPELPDRSNGNSLVLLPLSTKDKDSKTKEENHMLLNGNSVDHADRP
ncbi:hypothetical protein J1N35_024287 [Gossypium stocksii]|uniref:Sphingomyelin synthase-like domain-containing protein n=1 Tax=Gossypium stocksii TaxID=47602 RepID=A0A9D3VKS6_9ROSI|nr:hypothetical protein J1N35_024287 [Gossypium stocksii]